MTSVGAKVVIAASGAARKLGKLLDTIGSKMEVVKYTERLVPSTRFVAVDEAIPVISEYVSFIAPTANVIGDVKIAENSSVWYGATVRSEKSKVVIGKNSSIGDRAIVHDAKNEGNYSTFIGHNVTVGPGAIIHASTIEDNILIGASAQILEGCIVCSGSIVAPGSILTCETTVSSGELWSGSPAKMVRPLTVEEIACLCGYANEKSDLAHIHALECEKSFEQIVFEDEIYEDKLERDSEYWQPDNSYKREKLSTDTRENTYYSNKNHQEQNI